MKLRSAYGVVAFITGFLTLSACLDTDGEFVAERTNSADAQDAEDGVMPDVVCMNLQAAQDMIQKNDVFFSKSVDATGKGRKQVWDRNWIVVDQTPAAGAPIGEGDAVLSVVKEGEPSVCAGDEPNAAAQAAAPTTVIPTIRSTTTHPPTTVAPTTTTTVAPTTNPPTTTTTPTTLPPPTTTLAPITVAPTTRPPATVAFFPQAPVSECDPNYEGACVPIASDVDCAGGSGNGPEYVEGPVRVVGNDIYGLDGNDNDGIGCE